MTSTKAFMNDTDISNILYSIYILYISKSRTGITLCSILRTVSINQYGKKKKVKQTTWHSCSNKMRVRLCQELILFTSTY